MIVGKPGLRHGLGLEKFKLFLEVYKVRCANEGIVEIVALENVINVKGLDFVDWDWKDSLVRIGPWTGGDGLGADRCGQYDYREEEE